MPRTGKAFNLYLPDDVRADLERQAEKLRRPLHAEILHAIERHLAAPPVLSVPPLGTAQVSEPEPKQVEVPAPKKPRGRPRKGQ